MDFQRLLLVVALSFVLLMLYQAWLKDYGPQPPAPEIILETKNELAKDLPTHSAVSMQSLMPRRRGCLQPSAYGFIQIPIRLK